MAHGELKSRLANVATHLYEFGPYTLDVLTRRLTRDGEPVTLTPKTLDALIELIEHRDRVVGKAELMKRLWPDSYVEEANLTQTIFMLRKALGEAPRERQYIDTVPRRGYRFAVDVRETTGETAAVGTAAGRWLMGVRMVGAALAIVGLAAAAIYYNGRLRSKAPRATEPSGQPVLRDIAMTPLPSNGIATAAAISRDGRYVAYASQIDGQQSLWILQIATGSQTRIVSPSELRYHGLTFSPDSEWVYYLSGDSIQAVPSFGGSPRKLLENVEWPPALSPDGKSLAFIREDLRLGENWLAIANADGTAERRIATRRLPQYFRSVTWSPDGRTLACAVGTDAGVKPMSIVTVPVEGGTERSLLTGSWGWIGQIAWLRPNEILMPAVAPPSQLSRLWLVSYPEGKVARVTNDLDDYIGPSGTSDAGALVAIRRQRATSLWIISGQNAEAHQLTSGASRDNRPRWTSDGRIIYESQASGNLDIWAINADGTDKRQLTRDSQPDSAPALSPDDKYIAFVSDRTGSRHIWKMDLDGSNQIQLTTGGGEMNPDFSPDGRWVVYEAFGAGKPTIRKVPIEGGASVAVTETFSRYPAVSPDGRRIATYWWDERSDSPISIAVIPFAGGSPVNRIAFSRPAFAEPAFRWTRDGKGMTYVASQGSASDIYVQPLSGDRPQRLSRTRSDLISSFDWSRDGTRLVCARGVLSDHLVLIRDARLESRAR